MRHTGQKIRTRTKALGVGLLLVVMLLVPGTEIHNRSMQAQGPTSSAQAAPGIRIDAPRGASAAVQQPTDGRRSALLIGDSQSAGAANVPGFRTWPQEALRSVGYDVQFVGGGGLGFVASKRGGSPNYPTALKQHLWPMPAEPPALIVVEGGGNDARIGASRQRILRGVDETINALTQRYPGSQLLMIGTLAGLPSVNGSRRASVDSLLGSYARERGIDFVGAGDWLARYGLEGQLADRVHLDQAGHDALAAVLASRLRELGLAPGDGTEPAISWQGTNARTNAVGTIR
ncbi:MAG: SGNH/GDSL hydrolase family protein [Micrococcaceae bacterium]|nr:SGNH/GDSL hydrolase family protein [Micrococcaceae bacterium]